MQKQHSRWNFFTKHERECYLLRRFAYNFRFLTPVRKENIKKRANKTKTETIDEQNRKWEEKHPV